MNVSNQKTLLDFILKENCTSLLKIVKNQVCFLGSEFPIYVDRSGGIEKVKDIKLDFSISSKLTYQLWSLDFHNSELCKDGSVGGKIELRKKIIKLLFKSLNELKDSSNIEEVATILGYLEVERKSIKNDISVELN